MAEILGVDCESDVVDVGKRRREALGLFLVFGVCFRRLLQKALSELCKSFWVAEVKYHDSTLCLVLLLLVGLLLARLGGRHGVDRRSSRWSSTWEDAVTREKEYSSEWARTMRKINDVKG